MLRQGALQPKFAKDASSSRCSRPLTASVLCYAKGSTIRRAVCCAATPPLREGSDEVKVAVAVLDPAEDATAADVSTTTTATKKHAAWRWEESDDSLAAYGALGGLLLLGNVPWLQSAQNLDLPYFVGLAVMTIYIGAHRSLTTGQRQMISLKEGILAPVLASVSLFGCYLLVKYLPELSIQGFLNIYFWILGSIAGIGALQPLLRKATGPLGQESLSVNVPEGWLLDEDGKAISKGDFAPSDLLAVALAVSLSSANIMTNSCSFTLNNAIACLIATDILSLVGLRSFRTAGLMLAGLLAYDVFWVFGSPDVVGDNVMLTVATSDLITGPMRILFPRVAGGMGEGADFPFSLLGLGDIAIPGLLACLALRYDASRSVDMRARANAAVDAMREALDALEPGVSGRQMATAVADAALAAYDRVADKEMAQRERTVDGSHTQQHQDNLATLATLRTASSSGASTTSTTGTTDPSTSTTTQAVVPARVPVSDAVLVQRPYFNVVACSYIGGLLTAFAANSITHLGQPALLYIVPATLGSVVITAATRGELKRVWDFTDVPSFGPVEAAVQREKEEKERKRKEQGKQWWQL